MSDSKFYKKPPEGMRAVLSDNKFVGYVEYAKDPIENARRVKELLVEKGLHKDISIADSMFRQATSFANAANYIYRNDLAKLPRNPLGISPFIVNAAFSAEMYLKCLQQNASAPKQTHALTSLHKQLPNKVKDKINKLKKQLESQYEIKKGILFKEHLKNINNAFVHWRYIYEKEVEHVNIPKIIFVLDVLHQAAVEELGIGS